MPLLDPAMICLHRNGSGPSVVLLHGIGRTRGMWDGVARLSEQFELLTYDLPGHGETVSPAGPYEVDDLSEQLAAVLTSRGTERAHLVGSSLGGMVAQHFAATWPERVIRLVLCDTSPAVSEGLRDTLLTMSDHALARAAMARADLMDLTEDICAPTLVICADGADGAMREGADFLARSIRNGRLALAPAAAADAVTERPDWLVRVLGDFLAPR